MSRSLLVSFFLILCIPSMGWTQTPAGSPPNDVTGIEGTISVGPKGGPTRAGESDSIPLSNTAFEVKQDGRAVTEFQTDVQGHFRVLLPGGHYTVSRKLSQAVGFYGPFEVDVTSGQMSSVRWKCDSGLR